MVRAGLTETSMNVEANTEMLGSESNDAGKTRRVKILMLVYAVTQIFAITNICFLHIHFH
jgi:hypothetical protein